ncbi:response regulator, partial [Nostoc sp. NIES-2111]
MGSKYAPKSYALVVEDDPVQRALAVALFEESGLDVLEAATAEDALAEFRRHGVDVKFLFVDVGLPGVLDGVDLARIVRKLWPETVVIATSGLPPVDPLPAETLFLQKPWRALELLLEAEKAARA